MNWNCNAIHDPRSVETVPIALFGKKGATTKAGVVLPKRPGATTPWSKKIKIGRKALIQVILFEIDCTIFDTNLNELFCQFISWTNWVNSGKFMETEYCWISCQVMADMEKSTAIS